MTVKRCIITEVTSTRSSAIIRVDQIDKSCTESCWFNLALEAMTLIRELQRYTTAQTCVGAVWIICMTTLVIRMTSRESVFPRNELEKKYETQAVAPDANLHAFSESEIESFVTDLTKIKHKKDNQVQYFQLVKNVKSVTLFLPQGDCGLSFDAVVHKGNIVQGTYTIVAIKSSNISIDEHKKRARQMIVLVKSLQLQKLWSLFLDESIPFNHLLKRSEPYIRRMLRSCSPKSTGRTEEVGFIVYKHETSAPKKDIDNISYAVALFIGNCIVAPSVSQSLKENYEIPVSCMLSERDSRLLLSEDQWMMMQQLRSSVFRDICKLQGKFKEYLRTADDLVSVIPSVGTQMSDVLELDRHSEDKEDLWPLEEVDGRISELVRHYYHKCSKDVFQAALNTPIRNTLQRGQIKDLYMFARHVTKFFFMATYENGQKAFGKVLHDCSTTTSLGEGLKEIMAYYIDRLLVLNRFPHTVIKRLYFSSTKLGRIIITPEGNAKKFPWNFKQEELDYYEDYFVHDKSKNSAYIDIVFIGFMKEVTRMNRGAYVDFDSSLIARNSMENMTYITRQTLRDTTDIVLLDFISHNFDRKGDNVVRSELRMAAFDAGHGFKVIVDEEGWEKYKEGALICERQLERPPLLRRDIVVRAEIPSSCTSLPISRRSCHFSQFTVDYMRTHDMSQLSQKLKAIVDKEAASIASCGAFQTYKVYQGVDERLQHFFTYIKDCNTMFGNSIFI